MYRKIRNAIVVWFFATFSGMVGGAYLVYEYALVPVVSAYVDRGFCGQRDVVFGWPITYNCRDSFIGAQIQQSAMEEDHENVAILKDMSKKHTKK